MNTDDNFNPDSLPFNVLPDESQFFLYDNIPLTITESNQEYRLILTPLNGQLLITDQRVVWFNEPKNPQDLNITQQQICQQLQQHHNNTQDLDFSVSNVNGKSIQFSYSELVSHGLQSKKLMCFLGKEEWEDVEDIVEGELKKPNHDALFLEIENQKSLSDVVCVSGHFQLCCDLTNLNEQKQEELFENLTKFAVDYPQSADENNEGWGDMITADQIDDQGNLMADKLDDEDDDEDENMQEEEEEYKD